MTARAEKHWTQFEKDRLRWNWTDIPPEAIARELGRTLSAVLGMAHTLGLRKIKRGESITALAKRTGYHRTQIERALKQLGIRPRARPSCYIRKPRHGPVRAPHLRKPWSLIEPDDVERVLAHLGAP